VISHYHGYETALDASIKRNAWLQGEYTESGGYRWVVYDTADEWVESNSFDVECGLEILYRGLQQLREWGIRETSVLEVIGAAQGRFPHHQQQEST